MRPNIARCTSYFLFPEKNENIFKTEAKYVYVNSACY